MENPHIITDAEEWDLLSVRTHACFFSGHRTIGTDVLMHITDAAEEEVRKLADEGFDVFLCGGARGFDLFAANAVLRVQKAFPSIRLVMCLPCPEQTRGWSDTDRRLHDAICARGEVYCISPEYDDNCMKKRNRFLVDHAAVGIAYYTGAYRSGTGQTVRYAEKKGISVINLADRFNGPEEN